MDIPVLYVVFNRPLHTQQSFAAIRKFKPRRLFIAADGARPHKPEDVAKTEQVRAIVSEVDWDCEVQTLFREENVGAGRGVSEAISWMFEHVDRGVVLEDDCVPSDSFFPFCEELLNRYQDDTRVMHIAGTNHHPEFRRDPDYSYYFSYYGHMWGWATWKRAWDHYDITLPHFQEMVDKGLLYDVFGNELAAKYFMKKMRDARTARVDAWDYQWDFVRMMQSGMTIVPHHNLVQNIGFGEEATHTVSASDTRGKNVAQELTFPLQHPPYVIRDARTDNHHFRKMMQRIVQRKALSYLGINGYDARG
jgi:hypothetical protein